MSPKQQTNVRLELDEIAGLQRIKVRIGTPVAEQIRRAVRAWLAEHDTPPSTPPGPRARRGSAKRGRPTS